MQPAILSISEFTERVKNLLENQIGHCWLRGEVSNFRRQASGHCYFSLKDAFSQVPVVLFRRQAAGLSVDLRDGLQVMVHGRISVYEPRGAYQVIIEKLLPEGQGRPQMEFEQLKKKLSDEGLFDADRKRSLPPLPRTLGIITSPTGAALQDFISILRRRHWHGRLIVLPVKVQGVEAAGEIVAMLNAVGTLDCIDLLVLSRGGGSLEDLWPFNEEQVARAIAACPLPVISAVGHEIDFTLSDFVADRRAETPSAAAELISSHFLDMRERLALVTEALFQRTDTAFDRCRTRLKLGLAGLKATAPARQIEHLNLRLDDLSNRLSSAWRDAFNQRREQVQQHRARLAECSPEGRLRLTSQRVEHLVERLALADPKNVLKRGFVLVKDENNRILGRRSEIPAGASLINQFYDGEMRVRPEGAEE